MTDSYSLSVEGFALKTGSMSLSSPRPILGYVYRNFERVGISRPTQNGSPVTVLGLPDTVKLVDSTRVPLTPALQGYWFGLLRQYAPAAWTDDQVKIAWKSLTHGGRAFTNGHGWNNGYADYINGVNLDASPMMYEPIITGGNVIALRSLTKVIIAGVLCYPVDVLDSNLSPTTYENTRWTIQWATISRREGYIAATGKWTREDKEIRFPQLGDRDVPVPLLTRSGINFIPVARVRVLTSDDPIPNPYVF